MVNFYQWCKTPSSAFSKKKFSDDPQFLYVFGRAPSDVLCIIENSRTVCEIFISFHLISSLKPVSNTVYSEIMTIETVNRFRVITGRKNDSYEIPQSNTNNTSTHTHTHTHTTHTDNQH